MQIYMPVPRGEGGGAGIVLLYADNYEQIRPAYALPERGAVLGRDPGADIHVPTRAASRQHARFERRGDAWVLTDLGGRNGTLRNGEFVTEAALAHLDEIRIGDAIFKFVESDAERYAHYRIDGAYLDEPAAPDVRPRFSTGRIVGGYQIQRLATGLREVARSELSVLIRGESGTGKEIFARQLHEWSGRSGPFLAVNCAAIPAALVEGELFGHRRGAFSGADRDRAGILRAAHQGTLFLDEIGDMPAEAQAKLLRVIQSKEITPLGATQPEQIDVRIVAATHRDLDKLQQTGSFRADLFARLNDFSITLPPLRERKEDIFSLCIALAGRHGGAEIRPSMAFMAGLLHYDFPYNVREVEALIKRWAAADRGASLELEDLGESMRDRMKTYAARSTASRPPPMKELRASAAPPEDEAAPDGEGVSALNGPLPPRTAPGEKALRQLLVQHQGNVAAVARVLGRDRVQVHRWMKRYNMNVDDFR
ncbi:sigma-54 dependent transcriptional regulator [Sorangium cellulosum]|uniref:Sigma-54 dependent transcriptional regulator n=1 Tax=Sorangium cellulosum TaxID=56 RepID=A0A4P2Q877_SORCE|nr:sigma 54-interacting transcriptional regulator [Sorangium cellulosum]AUX25774.1 sigma-54 dependent transcriptional regulator [Sorangium cellulosum]